MIGIIALLISVLLPTLSAAREKGEQAACMSNARQIGVALQMFSNEHDGYMPKVSGHGFAQTDSWLYTLMPYLGDVEAVRACPAHPYNDRIEENAGTSYVLNEYLVLKIESGGVVLEDFTKLHKIRQPSEVPVVFELANDKGYDDHYDHTHSRLWFSNPAFTWSRITQEMQPDRHGSNAAPRTDGMRGTSTFLYADTHASAVSAEQIKSWADENYNFAIPRQ